MSGWLRQLQHCDEPELRVKYNTTMNVLIVRCPRCNKSREFIINKDKGWEKI